MMGVSAEFERAIIQEQSPCGACAGQERGQAPRTRRIRKALATPGRPGARIIAEQFALSIRAPCSGSAALSKAAQARSLMQFDSSSPERA